MVYRMTGIRSQAVYSIGMFSQSVMVFIFGQYEISEYSLYCVFSLLPAYCHIYAYLPGCRRSDAPPKFKIRAIFLEMKAIATARHIQPHPESCNAMSLPRLFTETENTSPGVIIPLSVMYS